MVITLKANLRKSKADKDGCCPVAISIRGAGEEKYHHTKIKVRPDQWDGEKIGKAVPNYDILNNTITTLIAETERKILLLQAAREPVTPAIVKALMEPSDHRSKGNDFHAFHKDYIKYLSTRFSAGYIRHLEVEQRQLAKYAPVLRFSDITDDWLERYEMQLDCAPTTKHTKMKRVKEVIDRAVAKGKIAAQHVASYKLPVYETPDGAYLTLAQTEVISDAIYKGELDFNAALKKVACYFLIECYSGIRFSDWHRFKVETLIHGRNLKVRAKKNGEPVYIPLDKFTRLDAILHYVTSNKIVFDLAEQKTNLLLKVLSATLKLPIPDLTTHVGRHTCGTLLGEMRWTTAEIAECLGISEKTAKTYVKHLRDKVRNAAERSGGL